jgi:hypothetical protein
VSKKVLFLDFDGVLHPTTHGSALLSQLPLLESALEGRDYSMVISSSWRFHMEMEDLKKHFSFSVQNKIVGVTGDAYIGAYARFHEINAYAMQNGITNWRALDDSYWEFPQGCSQLIRCNPNSGLTQREVKTLIEWLSQE